MQRTATIGPVRGFVNRPPHKAGGRELPFAFRVQDCMLSPSRRTARAAAIALGATLALWAASYAVWGWRSPVGGHVVALMRGCLIWHRAVPPGVLNAGDPALRFGGGLSLGGDPRCRPTWLPWLMRHRNRQGRAGGADGGVAADVERRCRLRTLPDPPSAPCASRAGGAVIPFSRSCTPGGRTNMA